MTKPLALGVAAFLSFCFSLGAEQPARALSLAQLNSLAPQSSPLFFQPAVFSRLGDPLLTDGSLGPTTFSNRETFSLATTYNLVGTPTSLLPTTMAMQSPARTAPANYSKDNDSPDYPLDLRPGYYVTGEVGFMYGRYTGKFGGDYKQGYIIGTVGNDKLQITAGASYEDSNWNGKTFRLGR